MKLPTIIAALLVSLPVWASQPKPPSPMCVDDNCASSDGLASGAIKWHPGHYMLTYRGDSHESLLSQRVPEVCKEPALKGLQLRLDWSDLEKSFDSYDFTMIDDVYGALERCNKYLVLQVQAVVFNNTSPNGFVPNYLLTDPKYNGGVARTKTGYIARLWEEPVMSRLIALSKALAEEYDNKSHFEGVVLAETATSKVAEGYSGSAYIEQLKRAIPQMVDSWKSTNVIVFNNFLQGSTEAQFIDFVSFLAEKRATMGGPDTLPPPNDGTKGELIYRGEIGGKDMRGLMPAMFAVQPSALNGKQGTFLPSELYRHCVITNSCSHMFWIRNTAEGGTQQKWDSGILPFIRANPNTEARCPKSYPSCRS